MFVELKLFGNKELFEDKKGNYRNIEEQVKLYREFIKHYKNEIKQYYVDLIKLKRKLGLLSKEFSNIVDNDKLTKYEVAEKPLLIIAGCTQKWIDTNAKDINNRINNYALGCLYFGEANKNSNIKQKGKKSKR